jgi:hypothetical protein
MHDKYGKDGLEVLTVITDEPKDAKSSANARKFLAEKLKAKFRSVQVDINTFDYDKKISSLNVPAAFVFNRDNLWVKRLPSFDDKGMVKEEVDYDLIEKAVAELMKK